MYIWYIINSTVYTVMVISLGSRTFSFEISFPALAFAVGLCVQKHWDMRFGCWGYTVRMVLLPLSYYSYARMDIPFDVGIPISLISPLVVEVLNQHLHYIPADRIAHKSIV